MNVVVRTILVESQTFERRFNRWSKQSLHGAGRLRDISAVRRRRRRHYLAHLKESGPISRFPIPLCGAHALCRAPVKAGARQTCFP